MGKSELTSQHLVAMGIYHYILLIDTIPLMLII